MAFENKEGFGVLFNNSHKKEANHPDYKGSAKVNGKQIELAAWIKEGKNGPFLSLSLKPPSDWEPGPKMTEAQVKKVVKEADEESFDIPF